MRSERHEGNGLQYITVVPDEYSADSSYPLVVMLHGFGVALSRPIGAPAAELPAAEMAMIRMTHVADLPSPEDLIKRLQSLPVPAPGDGPGPSGGGGGGGVRGMGAGGHAGQSGAGSGPCGAAAVRARRHADGACRSRSRRRASARGSACPLS